MSSDGRINAALFNFCIAADDGPRTNPNDSANGNEPRHRASLEDLRWLREAMASVEMPDRAVKRCATTITNWWIPVREKLPAASASAAAVAVAAAAGSAPLLMLPAPPQAAGDENKSATEAAAQSTAVASPPPRLLRLDDLPATIPADVLEATEELCELVEDLNYAKEFMLLKGVRATLDILAVAFDAANNSNGTSVLPGGATAAAVVADSSSSASSPETLASTAKQWSHFRCLLVRLLAGASANFDAFQAELVKHNWARVLVPQLTFSMRSNLVSVSTHSLHQPLRFVFPAETAALLLCVSNIMREHGPALEQFLSADGMFHLANVCEFLRYVTDSVSCESRAATVARQQHLSAEGVAFRSAWIVALRRAMSAARYLVEEHGVTSQRVLRVAVDVLQRATIELSKSTKPDQAASSDDASGYNDEDYQRDIVNMATGAAFAAKVLAESVKRSANASAAATTDDDGGSKTSIDKSMPVWGKHLVEKLSGAWWKIRVTESAIFCNELVDEIVSLREVLSGTKRRVAEFSRFSE
jgi:hypothetical protein